MLFIIGKKVLLKYGRVRNKDEEPNGEYQSDDLKYWGKTSLTVCEDYISNVTGNEVNWKKSKLRFRKESKGVTELCRIPDSVAVTKALNVPLIRH